MLRALTAILFILGLFSACTQRTICPAFQSAYIYDKDELRKKFSYLKEDSTPKIYSASKTKYLIAEPTSYRKKTREMRTVAIKPVYVNVPDSLRMDGEGLLGEEGEAGISPGDALDRAARSVIDSVYIEDVPQQDTEASAQDSVYVISKDREVRVLKYDAPDSLVYDENTGRWIAEKPRYAVVHVTFNVEQDNYMWYLRDYLVLPDVRQSRINQMGRAEDERRQASQKAGTKNKGFFKRLFGKKDESAPAEEPVRRAGDEEEFDFIDENQSNIQQQAPKEPEKKGLFRKRDKKPREGQRQADEEPEGDEPPVDEKPDPRQPVPDEAEVEGF